MADPKIKFKRSSVALKRPTLDNVAAGEFAINVYDGNLFTRVDTGGVGIATTISNLTPWTENFGAESITYSGIQTSVGVVTFTTSGNLILEGTVDGRDVATDGSNQDSLQLLTGVSAGATTLGTFTGTTISDNENIKTALQDLETALDNVVGGNSGAASILVSSTDTNASFFPTFVADNNASDTQESLKTDAGISYNPSSNILSVSGSVSTGTLNVSGVSTFASHVHLGDDDELRFGADNDFKIVHDPNDCRFENSNGDIKFKNTGSYFFFDEDGGETLASFINDGAVNLYYNNSKKFETTASGIDVTGHTETDTLNVSGVSTFQNDVTIGDSGTTPNAFFDVSTGNVGIGTTTPDERLFVHGKATISDDLFICGPNDNAFFVDASEGRLGVGTKTPERVLDLVGRGPFTADFQLTQHNDNADAGAYRLRRTRGTAESPTALNDNDGVGSLAFYRHDGSDYRKNASIEAEVENGDSGLGVKLLFQTSEGTTSAENRLAIMPTGEIGIGKDDPGTLLTIQGTSNLQDLLEFRSSNNRRLFIKTPATTHTRDAFQIQTENSLEFVVDSDLAMHIDHDSNVGIGTTAPTEKFEVYGKAVITDDFFVSGPDDRAFFVDASEGRLGVGTKNPERVLDLVGHGPFTADFQLTQHNDNADAGAFRLRRSRGTAASQTALNDNDGVGALAFYRYDGSSYRKNASVEAEVENGDSGLGVKLLFQTSEGTTSAEDRMVILPNGNIAIGKDSSSYKLNVKETSTNASDTVVSRFESSVSTAYLTIEDSTTTTGNVAIGAFGNNLLLRAGNSNHVRVTHDGKVGIGSDSPTRKLDVAGDVKVGINTTQGVILTSPNGTEYRLTVDNSGTLTAVTV